MMDKSQEIAAFSEYLIHHLVHKLESTPDDAYIMTIPLDQESYSRTIEDFGSSLKKVEGLDPSAIY